MLSTKQLMSYKRDDQLGVHCRVCKSWPQHSTLHNSGVMYRLSQICMSPYSRASKQVQGRNHQARNQTGTKPIGAHPLLSKGCTWGLCSRSVIHLGACKDHRMHPSHSVMWQQLTWWLIPSLQVQNGYCMHEPSVLTTPHVYRNHLEVQIGC